MDIKEFIGEFSKLFEETETSVFVPETEFKNIDEWGSLISLGLIGLARQKIGVRLQAKDINQVNTIQELYDLIESKKL